MNIKKWEADEYIDKATLKKYITTNYFDSKHEVFDAYVEMFKLAKKEDFVNTNSKEFYTLRKALENPKSCKSTEVFFGNYKDTPRIKRLRHEIDTKLGLRVNNKYNSKFNQNIYNIQKIIAFGVTAVEKLSDVQNMMPSIAIDYSSIGNATSDNEKCIIILADDENKYNTVVIARHSHSFELYDIKNSKTIAYKNYQTQNTFGDWSLAIERLCQTAYNIFISGHESCKVIHDINNEQLTKNEKFYKKIIISASTELSKHGNIKDNNDVKKITAELMNVASIDEINRLIKDGNKEELEKYLRKAYAESFVRLVDRKVFKPDSKKYSQKLLNVYTKHKRIPRDREYNEKQNRGQLYCYGGIVIDGGDNKYNQTSLEIKITDEAFVDLANYIGVVNPDNSDLIRAVQELMNAKSQTANLFDLDELAIQTYLMNRNKKYFSILESRKTRNGINNLYIPCEYYEYLKLIFKHNEQNPLVKRNYTSIFNIVIYESLSQITGKSYLVQ